MTTLAIAGRNLLQARRRSSLLALAIGLVTMLLVLLLSVSQGISDNLVTSATSLSAGHVNVSGFYKSTPADAAPIIKDVARLRAIVERETPGLDYVVQRHRGWAKLVSEAGAVQTGLTGIDLAEEQRFLSSLRLAPESEYVDGGREEVLGDLSALADPHSALLFANQARQLGVRVGDVVTIQTETFGGRTNTADVTVVAVAHDLGLLSGWSSFVPTPLLLELYQLQPDTSGALWVYLEDIDEAESVMVQLREVFAREGFAVMDHQAAPFFFKFDGVAGEDWTGQKLDLTIWRDEVSFLTWVITAFDTVTWLLIGVLVVIVAVGIMNAMWNAVRDRTREVGTLRAIGMQRGQILRLFLAEAGLLGLGATTAGALAGAVVALTVDAMELPVPLEAMEAILLSETVVLSVRPTTLLLAVVALTTFTAGSAIWPSWRASRLPPVTALGHAD